MIRHNNIVFNFYGIIIGIYKFNYLFDFYTSR